MTSQEIKTEINADATVVDLLAQTTAALATYGDTRAATEELRDPLLAKNIYLKEVSAAADVAAVEVIMSKVTDLDAVHENYKLRGRAICIAAYEPAKQLILQLAGRIQVLLAQYVADAVAAETAFFTANNLPVQETALRKVPQGLLDEINAIMAAENAPKYLSYLPNPYHYLLTWLQA